MRVREAAAALRATDSHNDVVLVGQALHVDAEIGIALAVDLHLVDSATLTVGRAALREEMPSTAHLRLGARGLTAAWSLPHGSWVSQGCVVAVLADVEKPLRLLLNKMAVLRVDIVALNVRLIVFDWWDVD